MSNPFVAVTQPKALTVTFKNAGGNVVFFTIPSGIGGTTQAVPLTGQIAGQNSDCQSHLGRTL